ncbi:hypothetical protein L5515_018904 [Caenorhabditis briggsae]|uniref:Uncharacterized protein n=1 Tax=Caenorhabditis briggsae TaxID=6238 RepID=A0AAE9FCQ5_CAEBR|nr:hypothetical protein L5515_018904 [Caenorhabditis briggsae]
MAAISRRDSPSSWSTTSSQCRRPLSKSRQSKFLPPPPTVSILSPPSVLTLKMFFLTEMMIKLSCFHMFRNPVLQSFSYDIVILDLTPLNHSS